MLPPPPVDPGRIPGLSDGLQIRADLAADIARVKARTAVLELLVPLPASTKSWARRLRQAGEDRTVSFMAATLAKALKHARHNLERVDRKLYEMMRLAADRRARSLTTAAREASETHGPDSVEARAAQAFAEGSRRMPSRSAPLAALAAFCGLPGEFPAFDNIGSVKSDGSVTA